MEMLCTAVRPVSNTSDEPELDAWLIFNRFYRPSEKVKGNGLGLAIVKAVCEYHEWQALFHSKLLRHPCLVTSKYPQSRTLLLSRI